MEAMDEMTLLREYAAHNSESAFETLVSRRAGFVYSAALRQVRDPHLAEEVTQAVFIILAQKAARLPRETILTGWLFKTTRFAALAQTRALTKRSLRTASIAKEFQMQTEFQSAADDETWQKISPLLDQAVASLGETDRRAILLRFFENKNLGEVGNALETTEDTARKRVSRALEKLRKYFSRRGVDSSAEIIAGALATNFIQEAPPGLVLAITATVVKGSAAATSTLTLVKGTLNVMAWIKAKVAVIAGASTLLAGAAILTVHAQEEKVRHEEQQIREEEQKIRAEEQQANLSPEQRQALEDKLQQLRAGQNALREQQNQLRSQDTNVFGNRSLSISPFTAVRFDGDKVMVTYSGAEYELTAIDGVTSSEMVAFCRGQYRDLWQKRIAEDLPIVLGDMNHPVNADHTVSLSLLDSQSGQTKTVEKAAMTEENRRAIMKVRLASQN